MVGRPGRRALAANLMYDSTVLEIQIKWRSRYFGVVDSRVVLKEAVSDRDSEIEGRRQHIYSLFKQGRHDHPRRPGRHEALIGWF